MHQQGGPDRQRQLLPVPMLTSNLVVSSKAYSPVKVDILQHYLSNYSEINEAKLLFEGFKMVSKFNMKVLEKKPCAKI